MSIPPPIPENTQNPEPNPHAQLRCAYLNLVNALELYSQMVHREASEGTQDPGKQSIIEDLIQNISEMDKTMGIAMGDMNGC